MHSAKNTVVAILLLGVSYGVYQVINAPAGGDPLAGLMRMSGDSDANEGPATTSDDDDWNTAALPPPPSTFPPLTAGRTLDEPSAPGSAPAPAISAIPALNPVRQPLDVPPVAPSSASITLPPPASSTVPTGLTGQPGNSGTSAFNAPLDDRLTQVPAKPEFAASQLQPVPASSAGAFVTAPVAGGSSSASSPASIDAIWPVVEQKVTAGDFRGALETLTPLHGQVSSSDPSRVRLNEWLDALAGKVIYSVEHHLDPVPYIVKSGDTLDSIAQAWSVPAQLVYNVNQQKIPNPIELTPGTELKQVRGPFHAVVHAGQQELTLYVNSLYAGRFPLATASAGLASGNWQIADKKEAGHTCGPYCLQLNQPGLALHAADAASSTSSGIAFHSADAKDLFNILTVGSTVSIR